MKRIILLLSLTFLCTVAIGQSVTITPQDGEIESPAPDWFLRGTSNVEFNGQSSGGTAAARTATPANRTILGLYGHGYTGTDFGSNARINLLTNETWSGSGRGTRMTFSTTANGSTSVQERMRITDEGDLGIGTTTPDGKMEISYNSIGVNPTLRLTETQTNDGARLTFDNTTSTFYTLYGSPSNTDAGSIFNLFHSGAEGNLMSWRGDGKVGIGTTAPATKLHVTTGGVTIDHDNSATDVINFKLNNPISAAGIKFNSSAGSLLGGYLHGQTRSHLFRGSNSNEGLTINSDNYVGLNNSNPDVPFHINYSTFSSTSTSGGMILGPLNSSHLTFDGNQIDSWVNTVGGDFFINYYSNGNVRIGNGPTGAGLDVNGFTNLGDGAPSIKMKKLTGTLGTGAIETVAHGLISSKILGMQVLVNNGGNYYQPSGNGLGSSTIQYRTYLNATDCVITDYGSALNSEEYTILLTYEE